MHFYLFFFNDTAPPEIYTLSLHDALPISASGKQVGSFFAGACVTSTCFSPDGQWILRSEEHTSELQSHSDLVCRLLLEKKKKRTKEIHIVVLRQNASGPWHHSMYPTVARD